MGEKRCGGVSQRVLEAKGTCLERSYFDFSRRYEGRAGNATSDRRQIREKEGLLRGKRSEISRERMRRKVERVQRSVLVKCIVKVVRRGLDTFLRVGGHGA
jgi:hypothetical protein